ERGRYQRADRHARARSGASSGTSAHRARPWPYRCTAQYTGMKQRAANRRHSASVSSAVQGRLASHLRCLVDALGRLHRRWLASLLTTIVIGITLALPAGLYVLAKNLNQLSYRWETSVQISM